jgi:hypothetical protein
MFYYGYFYNYSSFILSISSFIISSLAIFFLFFKTFILYYESIIPITFISPPFDLLIWLYNIYKLSSIGNGSIIYSFFNKCLSIMTYFNYLSFGFYFITYLLILFYTIILLFTATSFILSDFFYSTILLSLTTTEFYFCICCFLLLLYGKLTYLLALFLRMWYTYGFVLTYFRFGLT